MGPALPKSLSEAGTPQPQEDVEHPKSPCLKSPCPKPLPELFPAIFERFSCPGNSLQGWRRAWASGSLPVARKTLPCQRQQLPTGITDGTVKGANATQHKNYVENKGSYSCFKTFSQLELRAFNQLPFFLLFFRFFFFRFSFLPNICRGGKKLKQRERERNSFSCQSVACKAMKNTLRETSMYYRKGKGVHASSLLKSFKVPSLLRPPVSPSCSKPLKKEISAHTRLPEKLSEPSSLSWKFILVDGRPSVPWGYPKELWSNPGLLPGLLKLGKILVWG